MWYHHRWKPLIIKNSCAASSSLLLSSAPPRAGPEEARGHHQHEQRAVLECRHLQSLPGRLAQRACLSRLHGWLCGGPHDQGPESRQFCRRICATEVAAAVQWPCLAAVHPHEPAGRRAERFFKHLRADRTGAQEALWLTVNRFLLQCAASIFRAGPIFNHFNARDVSVALTQCHTQSIEILRMKQEHLDILFFRHNWCARAALVCLCGSGQRQTADGTRARVTSVIKSQHHDISRSMFSGTAQFSAVSLCQR